MKTQPVPNASDDAAPTDPAAGFVGISSEQLAEETLTFCRLLFGTEQTEYRMIHPKTGKVERYFGWPESAKQLGGLRDHNREGFNVFAVINQCGPEVEQRCKKRQGARDQDITGVRAVYIDLDRGTAEENLAKLAASPLAPSLTVCSGLPEKLHAYWLLADLPLEDFERTQEALIAHFGSDPKVTNLARVMRVPGFVNTKPEYADSPPLARLTSAPGHVYTRSELFEAFGIPDEAPPRPVLSRVNSGHLAGADTARRYALAALDNEAQALRGATEGNRNDQLNKSAFSLGQLVGGGELDRAVVESVLSSAAADIGLDDSEVPSTIRSGIEAGMAQPRSAPERPRRRGSEPALAESADDADDAEATVTFGEVLARAQSASIGELPRIFQDMRYLPDSQTRNAEREAIFDALKEATGVNKTALKRDYAASTPDQEQPERETLSQQLLNLVLEAGVTLWRDPDGEPYITLTLDSHQEHHRLKTQAVKRWIQRLWYEETGGAIGREPLSEALGVLEGKAIHDGEEHETFIRVAETGEGAETRIYVDMGDPHWHAIEVTAEGWRVIASAATPVRFIRSGGMLALPTPQPGSVADIASALGIPHLDPDDDSQPFRPFQASVAWLLQAFRVRGPFPILPLFGQQGAGKSTFTKRLCWLLDPHSATLRVLSRDDRDILISARHSWLQAKDNVSTLSQWTSDAFCRLATGGAISTRTLYTDGEETILNAKRPLLLNGITNFLEQQDLVDRAIVASLPAIPEEERRPESELEARYEEQRPRALGALLDIVATGLSRSGQRHLARLPRMADFAEWIVACSPALGWDAEDFLTWYAGTKTDLIREALDASPIVPYLLRLTDANPEGFERSPSDLLAELNDMAGLSEGRKRLPGGWPKRAQSLTNELKRLTPALLAAEGIEVVHGRDSRSKTWSFRNIGKSSASSAHQPWTLEKARPARASDDADESEAHRHPSALIGTDHADNADAEKLSAHQEARPARHHAENADDADEKPTLRGEGLNGIPPEVNRLHRLWRAGAYKTKPEHNELADIFSQPKATPAAQARLLELADALLTPPPGAPL